MVIFATREDAGESVVCVKVVVLAILDLLVRIGVVVVDVCKDTLVVV